MINTTILNITMMISDDSYGLVPKECWKSRRFRGNQIELNRDVSNFQEVKDRVSDRGPEGGERNCRRGAVESQLLKLINAVL